MTQIDGLEGCKHILSKPVTPAQLYSAIVNAPFKDRLMAAQLFLGIIVLLFVNEDTGFIERIALSDTQPAKGAVKVSVKRFEDIRIPLEYKDNSIAEAIRSNKFQSTSDWKNLFLPALNTEEARLNQAGAGIGYSAIYPLNSKKKRGALIFSYFQYPELIANKQFIFMEKYTALTSASIDALTT